MDNTALLGTALAVARQVSRKSLSSISNKLGEQILDSSFYPDLSYFCFECSDPSWDYLLSHDLKVLCDQDHYIGQGCSASFVPHSHPFIFPSRFDDDDAGTFIPDDVLGQTYRTLDCRCRRVQPRSSVTSTTLPRGALQRSLVSVPTLLGRRVHFLSALDQDSPLRSIGIKDSSLSVRTEAWAVCCEIAMAFSNVAALLWV